MFDPDKAADVLNVSLAFLEAVEDDDTAQDDVEAALRNIFDVAVEAVEAVRDWQNAFDQLNTLAEATLRELIERNRKLSAAVFTSSFPVFKVSADGVAFATR